MCPKSVREYFDIFEMDRYQYHTITKNICNGFVEDEQFSFFSPLWKEGKQGQL